MANTNKDIKSTEDSSTEAPTPTKKTTAKTTKSVKAATTIQIAKSEVVELPKDNIADNENITVTTTPTTTDTTNAPAFTPYPIGDAGSVSLMTVQRAFIEENSMAAGITEIQYRLSDPPLRLYAGTIDGLPGPRTKDAYSQFQAQVGAAITGIPDTATLTMLGFNVTW